MALRFDPIAAPYWTARTTLLAAGDDRRELSAALRAAAARLDEQDARASEPARRRRQRRVELRSPELAIVVRFPAAGAGTALHATALAAELMRELVVRAGAPAIDRLERCGQLLTRVEWSAGDE